MTPVCWPRHRLIVRTAIRGWSASYSLVWVCFPQHQTRSRYAPRLAAFVKLQTAHAGCGADSRVIDSMVWQVQDQLLLLERMYAKQLGLSEARLRAAVSYGGNPERLQRVLQKLIRGRAVNIATIGGSVTGAPMLPCGPLILYCCTANMNPSDLSVCCSWCRGRDSQSLVSRTVIRVGPRGLPSRQSHLCKWRVACGPQQLYPSVHNGFCAGQH